MEKILTLFLFCVLLSHSSLSQTGMGTSNIGPLIQPRVDVDSVIAKDKWENIDSLANNVAVVIGITDYQNVDPVKYAHRDADVVKEYLVKTFGYKTSRIIFLTDTKATVSGLKKVFAEQLKGYVVPGKSDVFVYYCGHGAPDPKTKEAYFVTYEFDPDYAQSTGYRVKDMYDQLDQLNARSVTIAIDACFSGRTENGYIFKNVSPVGIRVDSSKVTVKNTTVFTSSSGEEWSGWLPEKRHGLFTYYFLKGIRGDADENKNGEITATELQSYISSLVQEKARERNKVQTPRMMGNGDKVIVKY